MKQFVSAVIGGLALLCAYRAAEEVIEQYQQDGRRQHATQRHHEVALRVPEIAPQHRRRIAERRGNAAHRTAPFCVAG